MLEVTTAAAFTALARSAYLSLKFEQHTTTTRALDSITIIAGVAIAVLSLVKVVM